MEWQSVESRPAWNVLIMTRSQSAESPVSCVLSPANHQDDKPMQPTLLDKWQQDTSSFV
jgi:hypothetical protein